MTQEEYKEKVFRLSNIVEEAKVIVLQLEAATHQHLYSEYNAIRLSSTKIAEFRVLGTRLINACKSSGGFDTLGELLRHSPREVENYKNVGKKVIMFAQQIILKEYGIEWK